MNNTIQIRVNPKTKQSAASVLRSLGLDMSSGINMFLHQVILRQGIPFPVVTENGYTPEQEAKLLTTIKRFEADRKAGRLKSYKSVRGMTKDIMAS